jgi:hypothetical protein
MRTLEVKAIAHLIPWETKDCRMTFPVAMGHRVIIIDWLVLAA